MPGGGTIAGMIVALKNNALLIRKRKSLRDISGKYPRKHRYTELEFPEASPEELKAFHAQLIKQKRRNTVLLVSLALLFLAAAVILVAILMGTMS